MILVDEARWPWRGRYWAHLVGDDSYEELHEFATRLGVDRVAFQGDHYDVPTEYRRRAIEMGAHAIDSRQLVARLRAAGLRSSARSRSQQGAAAHHDGPASGRASQDGRVRAEGGSSRPARPGPPR